MTDELPDHTIEWLEGFSAAIGGQPQASCPYTLTTDDAQEWLSGYKTGIAQAGPDPRKAH